MEANGGRHRWIWNLKKWIEIPLVYQSPQQDWISVQSHHFHVLLTAVTFSTGVETSEESDSSDTDDMCGSQQGWVDPTDSLCLARRGWDSLGGDSSSRQQQWLDPSGTTPAWSSKSTSCQRSNTIAAALASYRRQVSWDHTDITLLAVSLNVVNGALLLGKAQKK